MTVSRSDVSFESHGSRCAAYLYWPLGRKGDVPCVVLAHGLSATRDEGLEGYAERFAAAGMASLVFDYRHFGSSEGKQRQLVDVGRQQEDYRAALRFVRELEGVDTSCIALWGTSFSGAHVLAVAQRDSAVKAVIAQVPGAPVVPRVQWRVVFAGIRDAIGARFGRPVTVRAVGKPGTCALITEPEAQSALESLAAPGSEWRNEVHMRGAFGGDRFSPDRLAVPVLVCAADQDRVVDSGVAERIAEKAPRGEIRRYSGGHFGVYFGAVFERAVSDQVEFLLRNLRPDVSDSVD